MALRALARRSPTRSFTVLGDLAQATAPAAQSSWAEVLRSLDAPTDAEVVELRVGYRVPAPIMDVANRLLAVAAPDVALTTSIRDAGEPPRVRRADPARLPAVVAQEADRLRATWATVGVLCPEDALDDVTAALQAAAVPTADGRRTVPGDGAVAVLEPVAAKGLEFDAVVVVEPAAVAVDAAGARLLFVALTRAVQELVIVHAADLPAPLAPAGEPAGAR